MTAIDWIFIGIIICGSIQIGLGISTIRTSRRATATWKRAEADWVRAGELWASAAKSWERTARLRADLDRRSDKTGHRR